MTTALLLLRTHSFPDTTKTEPEKPMFGAFGFNLAQKSPFESTTQASQPAFGGRWGSKFNKIQLKMAVARIKLLWNKRRAVVKQMRRDIALLLQSGQDDTA
ncbi:hypothetical protein ACFX2B_031461 [Malus domestica]